MLQQVELASTFLVNIFNLQQQIFLYCKVWCTASKFWRFEPALTCARTPPDNDPTGFYFSLSGEICAQYKGPFTQAIFAAIFLLLMHAIKWMDLRMN